MDCTSFQLFFVRLRGTIITKVWWQVLIMTIYSAVLVFLYDYYKVDEKVEIPTDLNIFQVLGIVTGMLLVFRTNTAYDRYWEGRRLWSEMVQHIRIITRTIWVMVDDNKDPKVLVGKISLLNLLVGFAYATKHYLREEYSREEEDLTQFVSHLPQLQTPSSNEPLQGQERLSMGPSQAVLKHIRSKMSNKTRAKMKATKHDDNRHSTQPFIPELNRTPLTVASNIPLEISCYISSYFVSCKSQNLIDSPTCRVLDTAVGNMVNCLTGFERIRRTPIPFAYCVHLQQITWIVLLILPFQWIAQLKWLTIPATAVASFALFGILGIGREIENPFGYDWNDLNLDDFCNVIHKEVIAIISQPIPKPDTWLYSDNNFPIITNPSLSAAALAKLKYSQIHMVLSQGKDYKFFHRSKSSFNEVGSSKSENQGSEKISQDEQNKLTSGKKHQ